MLIQDALSLILSCQAEYEQAAYMLKIQKREPSNLERVEHEGRLAGLEACRDLKPVELAKLRHKVAAEVKVAIATCAGDLAYRRARRDQIDMVANVFSVFLRGIKERACGPITNQGIVQAGDIFGIRERRSPSVRLASEVAGSPPGSP